MQKLLFMVVLLLCVSACTKEDSGTIKPDSGKPELSAEEKAKLEAEEKARIAQAQKQGPTSPSLSAPSGTPGICGRTEQVKRAILTKLSKEDCSKVTRSELEAIFFLSLGWSEIDKLKAGDFESLTSLGQLKLQKNQLASLPENLFQGLTSLKQLFLNNNPFSDEMKEQIKGRSWPPGLELTI